MRTQRKLHRNPLSSRCTVRTYQKIIFLQIIHAHTRPDKQSNKITPFRESTTLRINQQPAMTAKQSHRTASPADLEAGLTGAERRERDAIVPYLMRHAYHLPGNSWSQDWWQYMTNNHPVFSLCLRHRYHPLGWKLVFVNLLGSMLFGLALTSIVYCVFVFMGQDSEQELLRYQTGVASTGIDPNLDSALTSVSVTTGNLVLFFVGAPIHGLYDSLSWMLAGCSCITFKPEDSRFARVCRTSGALILSLSLITIAAVTSFSVMLRVALEADQDVVVVIFDNTTNTTTVASASNTNVWESQNQVQGQFQSLVKEQNFEDYQFLISYGVELALSYLVYYPLVETIFFSGILASCCCAKSKESSFWGGRPYEVEQEGQGQGVEVEFNAPPPNKASTTNKKGGR
jgi:hypothetical protein